MDDASMRLLLFLTLAVASTLVAILVDANPGRTDESTEFSRTRHCYKTCIEEAEMELWPTTPPSDEDDEEPRCKSDIKFTSDCIYQCEDLSVFSCISKTLKVTPEKLKKVLKLVSTAKYCQGCRFFDNENCKMPPEVRQLFNSSSSTSSQRHPYIAALSPFMNGLYLLDETVCRSESKSLRQVAVEANALDNLCRWLHCETVHIQTAPGCFDVAKYLMAIAKVYSDYLECPSPSIQRQKGGDQLL